MKIFNQSYYKKCVLFNSIIKNLIQLKCNTCRSYGKYKWVFNYIIYYYMYTNII